MKLHFREVNTQILRVVGSYVESCVESPNCKGLARLFFC